MNKVFLSRRNLLPLVSKLNRVMAGQRSECTIVKSDNVHPRFAQTMEEIAVVAVEDTATYFSCPTPQVHLSRASIARLLWQLDQVKAGRQGESAVVIGNLTVTAVEDADYYTYRPAGEVLPVDDPLYG